MKFSCWRHEKSQILNWNFWNTIDLFCVSFCFLFCFWRIWQIQIRSKKQVNPVTYFYKNCQNHFQILFFFYLFWVAFYFWYIYQLKFEIKVWNQKIYLAAMSEYFALKIGNQFIEMCRLLKVVRHREGICAEL